MNHVETMTTRRGFPDWVSAACLLVRRNDAEAVGLLDERYFMYGEDVDFCAALRKRGRRILFEPAATVSCTSAVSRRKAAPSATGPRLPAQSDRVLREAPPAVGSVAPGLSEAQGERACYSEPNPARFRAFSPRLAASCPECASPSTSANCTTSASAPTSATCFASWRASTVRPSTSCSAAPSDVGIDATARPELPLGADDGARPTPPPSRWRFRASWRASVRPCSTRPHYVLPALTRGRSVVTIHDCIHLMFPQYLPHRLAYRLRADVDLDGGASGHRGC